MANPKPVRVCRGVRPLYIDGKDLYCSKGDRLILTSDAGKTFRNLARIEYPGRFAPVLAKVARTARVLRLTPYRLIPAGEGHYVFHARPGTYTMAVKPDGTQTQSLFRVSAGSRPTSLAQGKDGLIVFGEYIPNEDRQSPILVYGSRDRGLTWQVLHTFPSGAIRHIHGISYDRWLDCFWITSGDYPQESTLWRANADFSDVTATVTGSALNRYYSVAVTERYLVMASDSPSIQNKVSRFDKETGELSMVADIQNSSFYSGIVKGRLFLSTNCEWPDQHAELSATNDIRASHVWASDPPYENWREVACFPTDFEYDLWRKPRTYQIFQFPRVFFPDGVNDTPYVFAYLMGLRPYSDSLCVYESTQF